MIIETGTIVFLSLIVIFWRMSRRTQLWLLGHPLWLEVPFGFFAYALHYGTFSGMMAAATAVCCCYAYVEVTKRAVGFVDKDGFHPGIFRGTP